MTRELEEMKPQCISPTIVVLSWRIYVFIKLFHKHNGRLCKTSGVLGNRGMSIYNKCTTLHTLTLSSFANTQSHTRVTCSQWLTASISQLRIASHAHLRHWGNRLGFGVMG